MADTPGAMMEVERGRPHSEESEAVVIGSTLLSPEILPQIADLSEQHFFMPPNAAVWACISSMAAKGARVDIVTLGDELKRSGLGSRVALEPSSYLVECAKMATIPEHALYHAGVVRKLATMRALIGLCVDARSRAEVKTEPDEIFQFLRDQIAVLEVGTNIDGPVRIIEVMDETMAEIEARARRGTDAAMIKLGISAVDHVIGGVEPGQLAFVGGAPGMGKTSLLRGWIEYCARNGVYTVAFVNEGTRMRWIAALIALRARVAATDMIRGRLGYADWKMKIQPAAKKLCDYPCWIDVRSLTTSQIIGESHRWLAKCGTEAKMRAIVIDQLNLIPSDEPKAESRNREIGSMVRRFKRLAIDTKSAVIVAAQLNRAGAKAEGPPTMFDFRDCGEIEAFADCVLLPYRPGYGKPESEEKLDQIARDGYEQAQIVVGKQKDGATGGIDVAFYRERMEYADLPSYQPPEPPENWKDDRPIRKDWE